MVYQYLEFYEQAGIQTSVSPLFDDHYFDFQVLDRPTGFKELVRHSGYYLARIAKRMHSLLSSAQYDVAVFDKELVPYLPYGLEAILNLLQPRTIVLFDEPTWVYYRQHPYPLVRLLCRNKIERIARTCSHIIAWNKVLGNTLRQFNTHVSVVNSGIDLRRYPVKNDHTHAVTGVRPVVIGWIGTPNSYAYLRKLEDVFKELSNRYPIELHVISSQEYHSPHIRVINEQWSLQTEVDHLLSMDIGIMPLPDNEWARSKSGAKAVQYMGVGVPVVCSTVGVASQMIQDGVNGFLAADTQEWMDKLARLVRDPTLRREIGLNGRQTVETLHSTQAIAPRLISILEEVSARS
jgi:glycosyltransferase involved in cell wall biosynthesis